MVVDLVKKIIRRLNNTNERLVADFENLLDKHRCESFPTKLLPAAQEVDLTHNLLVFPP